MSQLSGISILIVDDEPDLLDVFGDQFSHRGAQVFRASNGTQAWELLQKQQVDIVFSDIRMPGGDGVELAKNIQKMPHPKPKVFLCSGFSDISLGDAQKYGVITIFPKPFKMEAIAEIILNSLNSSLPENN